MSMVWQDPIVLGAMPECPDGPHNIIWDGQYKSWMCLTCMTPLADIPPDISAIIRCYDDAELLELTTRSSAPATSYQMTHVTAAADNWDSLHVCSTCGAMDLKILRDGDMTCMECGVVAHAHMLLDDRPPRHFANDDAPEADPTHHGGASDELASVQGLQTTRIAQVIGQKASGSGGAGGGVGQRRLQQLHHASGKENLRKVAREDADDLARAVSDVLRCHSGASLARQLYLDYTSEVQVPVLERHLVKGACAMIACGKAITGDEVASCFGADDDKSIRQHLSAIKTRLLRTSRDRKETRPYEYLLRERHDQEAPSALGRIVNGLGALTSPQCRRVVLILRWVSDQMGAPPGDINMNHYNKALLALGVVHVQKYMTQSAFMHAMGGSGNRCSHAIMSMSAQWYADLIRVVGLEALQNQCNKVLANIPDDGRPKRLRTM
jgi:transcription initiation factor TFIIIB Brf1 subunit/transcription initiation factor TFIIB